MGRPEKKLRRPQDAAKSQDVQYHYDHEHGRRGPSLRRHRRGSIPETPRLEPWPTNFRTHVILQLLAGLCNQSGRFCSPTMVTARFFESEAGLTIVVDAEVIGANRAERQHAGGRANRKGRPGVGSSFAVRRLSDG